MVMVGGPSASPEVAHLHNTLKINMDVICKSMYFFLIYNIDNDS